MKNIMLHYLKMINRHLVLYFISLAAIIYLNQPSVKMVFKDFSLGVALVSFFVFTFSILREEVRLLDNYSKFLQFLPISKKDLFYSFYSISILLFPLVFVSIFVSFSLISEGKDLSYAELSFISFICTSAVFVGMIEGTVSKFALLPNVKPLELNFSEYVIYKIKSLFFCILFISYYFMPGSLQNFLAPMMLLFMLVIILYFCYKTVRLLQRRYFEKIINFDYILRNEKRTRLF